MTLGKAEGGGSVSDRQVLRTEPGVARPLQLQSPPLSCAPDSNTARSASGSVPGAGPGTLIWLLAKGKEG